MLQNTGYQSTLLDIQRMAIALETEFETRQLAHQPRPSQGALGSELRRQLRAAQVSRNYFRQKFSAMQRDLQLAQGVKVGNRIHHIWMLRAALADPRFPVR
jgi:hypothetical protein